MWMGKIGSKSANFIMHKPFHPGNFQNLEKVWQAEEKKKREEKMQQEMLERRQEESKIEELRRAVRQREMSELTPTQSEMKATGKRDQGRPKAQKPIKVDQSSRPVNKSKYKEDVHVNGHTAVWGSYYDPDMQQWGYKCCRSTDRHAECTGRVGDTRESEAQKPRDASKKRPHPPEEEGRERDGEAAAASATSSAAGAHPRKKVKSSRGPALSSGLADILKRLNDEPGG
ncbi:unnamed protein product [Vitrella brassicaformis CCMP3155]|uniref:Pre-mRNA-splicing factor SLU7 n=1 Tax=Vitrella brassicaformis (strain CCMP3155) TaxID=1169540 RepID=A0A0G4F433_VITBC|nr:unnamed protein product [Vitrella brassicaformis CCMP3155]|mmetsp:Transcript_40106/g.100386  ORF Transcript_40106/g.100386 Transcript_40106/m.100386 type:complete len:229 (-) Transcript_40106:2108-2794(-)|eukprot:CEM06780.1 unnamed protein product [Vitrella brassicaformis CCMP3155]